MKVDDYLDFENPADDCAAAVYQLFRRDARTPKIIEALQALGHSEAEIGFIFRLISRIPGEWETDKEARKTKEKRRIEMAKRLRALLPGVEDDPDLSGLYFGTGVVSIGSREADDGLVSFPDCIRAGISALESVSATDAQLKESEDAHIRALPLKRYAIRTVFDLIEIEGKRAPNKLTAQIVSVLLSEPVTPNDITQARKDIRRRNFRDK